jgi:hypoxanthine phosphoribosyltransferase
MGVDAAADWQRDLASVLLTEEQIHSRVAELAAELAADYHDKHPLLIGILKGSIVFLSDLMRKLSIPLEMDLVCCSSYGQSATSSGRIELRMDLSRDLRGRHVVLVEDIVDTGLTLSRLIELLRDREPESLKVCCLLSKPSRRQTDVQVDYVGFEIPDEFVVGYGLDYAERYRWLPHLAVVNPTATRGD